MSLFLIRSTLRGGWAVGLAIGAGIALVDALYAAASAAGAAGSPGGAVLLVCGVGAGSLTWVVALASGTAAARRTVGERAMRAVDAIAGVGLIGFGGVLAHGALHQD